MSSDLALQLMADMLWTCVQVSAPILGVMLLVGVVISILQVVTQIQEMSLVFVPKLISAVIALVIFGPWMLRKLTQFAVSLIGNIPQLF